MQEYIARGYTSGGTRDRRIQGKRRRGEIPVHSYGYREAIYRGYSSGPEKIQDYEVSAGRNGSSRRGTATGMRTTVSYFGPCCAKERTYTTPGSGRKWYINSRTALRRKTRGNNWLASSCVPKKPGTEEFKDCIKACRNRSKEILHSIQFVYTNAFTEGMNNNIKVLKRIASGYRNQIHFRARILSVYGKKPA